MKQKLNLRTRIFIMLLSLAVLILPALIFKDQLVETGVVLFRHAKAFFLQG